MSARASVCVCVRARVSTYSYAHAHDHTRTHERAHARTRARAHGRNSISRARTDAATYPDFLEYLIRNRKKNLKEGWNRRGERPIKGGRKGGREGEGTRERREVG